MILRPAPELSEAFRHQAMLRPYNHRFLGGQPACWLAIHDPQRRSCGDDRWEAFHFIGRQEIRNLPQFFGLDPEIVMQMEWDPRLGGPACVTHHRPYDNQGGERLIVPRYAVPADVEELIVEYGLETLAERRFSA